MIKKLFYLVAALILSINTLIAQDIAQLKLPSIVGDNMVLQQNSNTSIWGWAKPGSKVEISTSWDNNSYSAKAEKDGKWKVTVKTVDAGGPYSVTIKADTTIRLNNILMGEVWICSGQSNMQQPLKGYYNQPTEEGNNLILKSKNNQIRVFQLTRKFSDKLEEDCEGDWKESSPANIADFSAVAYIFGKELNETLNIPIGLIHTSWGGTPIESWIDENSLKEIEYVPNPQIKTRQYKAPSVLYNAMINPLLNYTIKGAIWYQGESNKENAHLYQAGMDAMVNNWREQWDCGKFPFIYVQIAPYSYDGKKYSAKLREAQLKYVQNSENTGMVSTMDIGSKNYIHPPKKREVGERLSLWAFANVYGIKGISYSGPLYRSLEIKDNKAIVKFDHADSGLSTNGMPFINFEIAGADKQFVSAKAKIIKNGQIIVWSDKVSDPVAVRYCWSDWCEGELFNGMGLPASSFRTDNW